MSKTKWMKCNNCAASASNKSVKFECVFEGWKCLNCGEVKPYKRKVANVKDSNTDKT